MSLGGCIKEQLYLGMDHDFEQLGECLVGLRYQTDKESPFIF